MMIDCAACAHWARWQSAQGACRRNAPEPSTRSGSVAHWPETLSWQGCGEGDKAEEPGPKRRCDACCYWKRPPEGLDPVDRGDMRREWWRTAGLCVRRAPRPSTDPGPRAFWHATQDSDFCGQWRHR